MPPTESSQPTPADDMGFEIVPDAEATEYWAATRAMPMARRTRMPRWVQAWLLLMAAGFSTILGIALWLSPYNADGSPRLMATHTQMGLPPCNMVVLTGKPCPACGMTTSFALLAHGDVLASLQANWVGTLLAVYWFALIPWSIWSAIRGRLLGVRNGEILMAVSIGVVVTLMLARWIAVILL